MTQMPHSSCCSAALGCSFLDHASVANIQFCLPSPSFVSFGDREIFHNRFWSVLQLSLQTYHLPSLSPVHTRTQVSHIWRQFYICSFSLMLPYDAAAYQLQLNQGHWPSSLVHSMIQCYLLTLWWRKLVHYLTGSRWLIDVQEVWQSHLLCLVQ